MLASLVRGVWPGAIVAIALAILVVVAPGIASRLFRENGVVEWLQVALAVVALGFVVRSAVRRFSPADVVAAVGLVELIFAEVDLDRRLIGVPIFDWKFLRRTTLPLPVRIVVVIVVAALAAALLAYVVRRRRELARELQEGFHQGWGWLLVAGLVLFGIPQPCERCLDYAPKVPMYLLEESLELLGLLYVALGLAARSRRP